MIETKEKTINGAKYTVTQMTARKALRMKAKLLRLFGPAIAQIFLPGEDKPMEGMAFSKEEAVKALANLALELDENNFERLCMELMVGVRKDNVELSEAVIDLEFAGDLSTLFKVLWFVLEVNFASFFGEGGIGSLFVNPDPQAQASTKKGSTKR